MVPPSNLTRLSAERVPPIPSEASIEHKYTETILLCAWMGALPKHVAKYVEWHRKRSPTAQIIPLESTVTDVLIPASDRAIQARYQPVVEHLERSTKQANHPVLLHTFSNGGCATTIRLASAWRLKTHEPLPVTAVVLDSCPGSGSLELGIKAITLASPKRIRWLATILMYTFLLPLYTVMGWLGVPNPIDALRTSMNDPTLIPLAAPRVYLYSKADQLIPTEAVEEHQAAARQVGYKVSSVQFQQSAHVMHVAEDMEKYWKAIDAVQTM